MNKINQEIRIGSMHILGSNSKYRDNSQQRAIKKTLIFSQRFTVFIKASSKIEQNFGQRLDFS